MIVLVCVLIFIIGISVGYIISKIMSKEKPIGDLRIDNSDPDDVPYLFLELDPTTNIRTLGEKKRVTMNVVVKNYISHE